MKSLSETLAEMNAKGEYPGKEEVDRARELEGQNRLYIKHLKAARAALTTGKDIVLARAGISAVLFGTGVEGF